ncbi:uncharacterized protein V6R79_007228 [Siganus canaliculatus]
MRAASPFIMPSGGRSKSLQLNQCHRRDILSSSLVDNANGNAHGVSIHSAIRWPKPFNSQKKVCQPFADIVFASYETV